eukprot:scaffold3198_cov213-Alexandrium_tamarense.AAC.30
MDELQGTVRDYADQHLPGAGGSIDVVHVKWSRCPAVKFGARSNKHVVRFDPTVDLIKKQWYKDVEWQYYTIDGELKTDKSATVAISDGREELVGQRGYFNTNLESIHKDVECTFGILKKRWRILNKGLNYHDMKKCEMVFTVCCVLHNMLLDAGRDKNTVSVIRLARVAFTKTTCAR